MTICITGEPNELHQYQQISHTAEKLDKGILIKYYLIILKQFNLGHFIIDIMIWSFVWYSKTDCVEHNIDYYGSKIYNVGDKFANTEKLCQKACQEHPECNWWSLSSINDEDYGCWLKTEKNSEKKQKILGRSFGPKFCGMYWM